MQPIALNSCDQQHLTLVPKPHQRLASALEALKGLQEGGAHAIPGPKLSRADREALLRAGFLKPVIRGWYFPRRPDEAEGDTTAWYASMREFVADYARARFGERWHVNPEQSVLLHSGERTIPRQVQLWAAEGTNQTIALPTAARSSSTKPRSCCLPRPQAIAADFVSRIFRQRSWPRARPSSSGTPRPHRSSWGP